MSTINNNITGLFSSLNQSNSSLYNMDLNTLSSIKTGSYKKLLKSYYANESEDDSESKTASNNASISSDKEKNNAISIKDAATSLMDDVSKLTSSSLWEKKEVTKDDKTSMEYDREAIYKEVTNLVNDYNALVKATADTNDKSSLRTASNMVKSTKINASLIESVGISLNADNTLSLDKDNFMKADIGTLKSIFASDASIANKIRASASTLNQNATSALGKLAATGSYSSDGGYTYVTGSNYNSII